MAARAVAARAAAARAAAVGRAAAGRVGRGGLTAALGDRLADSPSNLGHAATEPRPPLVVLRAPHLRPRLARVQPVHIVIPAAKGVEDEVGGGESPAEKILICSAGGGRMSASF